MVRTISKNAQRQGAQELISRWGGEIIMRSLFKNSKMHHFAECSKSSKTARKPWMLM